MVGLERGERNIKHEAWEGESGEEVRTFNIKTTVVNTMMQGVGVVAKDIALTLLNVWNKSGNIDALAVIALDILEGASDDAPAGKLISFIAEDEDGRLHNLFGYIHSSAPKAFGKTGLEDVMEVADKRGMFEAWGPQTARSSSGRA